MQYNFILKVDVFGAEKGVQDEIAQFVKSWLPTRQRWQIDLLELEKTVRKEFDEISSVSVTIIGQSLIIGVNQVDVPEEMSGEYQPIISQYDGRVEKIYLVQGTLAVNEGDLVQKGDILVFPYIYDSQGEQIPTLPKADIYAEVWLIGEEVHYDYYIKTERTGRSVTLNQVYLKNLLTHFHQD